MSTGVDNDREAGRFQVLGSGTCTMPALNIRRAIPSEAKVLSRLAKVAKATWGYSPAQLQVWKADLTVTPAQIEDNDAYVAESGGRIIAFYILSGDPPELAIDHFWVEPTRMRRGVGASLLSHALARGSERGAESIAIDADPYAEAFYVARGARRVGMVAAPINGEPDRVRPQLKLKVD